MDKEELRKTIDEIYEGDWTGTSAEEVATMLFNSEANYNNCDKTSGQIVWSYSEIKAEVDDIFDEADAQYERDVELSYEGD